MVSIHFEDTETLDLDPGFFGLWLGDICLSENRVLGAVALVMCSDEYLLKLNKDHLNHDYYTDIITFDYCEGLMVGGDLFISIDRVRENAGALDELFHVELRRVVAHGVLHLIGFQDKTEDESFTMRAKENEALALFVSRET